MADKDFKVKNKLFVNGLSNSSGVILATNNALDASTSLPTQYGGTGTTTSPNAGQILYSSAGTNYAPTDLSSLTISTNGGSTITPSTTSTVGLTLASPVGQTGHLLYAAGGTRIPAGGNYLVTPGLTVSYVSDFNAGAANITPIYVKGAASQTADLQRWQNSSGTVLSSINNAGALAFSNTVGDKIYLYGTEYGIGIQSYATVIFASPNTAGRVSIRPGYSSGNADAIELFTSGRIKQTLTEPGSVGNIIKAAASQTANLQEWQDSSGTAISWINSSGNVLGFSLNSGWNINWGATPILAMTSTGLIVNPYNASRKALIIQGAASQSANLQEWQNSSGTVLSFIRSDGLIRADAKLQTPTIYGSSATSGTQVNIATAWTFVTNVATNVGIIVKGAASQTANLTEWQNNSGTVLASISAAGNLTVQDLTVNGTTTTINSTTLTVDDKNIELASVSSPTDTTADGAGITIKGATDKTFNWVQSTGAFTSSEPISTPALSVSGNSVSSNITLAAGKRYFVDTTSARTLTLPASPSLGDEIQIFDASGTAATNNITIARNGNKINGITDDAIIDVNQVSSVFVYTGATVGWRFE